MLLVSRWTGHANIPMGDVLCPFLPIPGSNSVSGWRSKTTSGRRSAGGGHPLIGQRLPDLAHLPDSKVWENVLNSRFNRYLASHFDGVMDEKVINAIGLTAANEAYGSSDHHVAELNISHPLVLDNRTMQVVLEDQGEEAVFRIFSHTDDEPWTENANGRIKLGMAQTDWLYELEWQSQALTPSQVHKDAGRWLIFV